VLRPAFRHAVTVLDAEQAGRVLGQRVAVPLAVRGPYEGADDFDAPFGDVVRLAPEIGETDVDVELQQVDP
jgi:hypothetical protein